MKQAATKKQVRIKELLAAIESAAKLYKQTLVGRKFLYVFDGRYIEVIYKAQNFKHLTGVESPLSAKRFYSNALHGQLEANQISFSKAHPYELCLRKVKHLHEIADLAQSESFMLEEISTKTQSYKFGTTDLNFTLCMNRELDTNGNERSECYIVQSLRDEDCFARAQNVYTVTHVLAKSNDVPYYTELVYLDRNEALSTLPQAVLSLVRFTE